MKQTGVLPGFRPPPQKGKRPRPAELEADIQKACLQWLNVVPGIRAWRQNRGAKLNIYRRKDGTEGRSFVKFGEPGASDITGLAHGIRLEVETKSTGKVPSFDQENYLRMIRDADGIAFWCDSLNECIVKLREEYQRRGWAWRSSWEVWS